MRVLLAFAAAATLAATGAMAQPKPAAPAKPAMTTTTTSTTASKSAVTRKPRTAKSLDCSKQADGKNIHGKERKKFMTACKKA